MRKRYPNLRAYFDAEAETQADFARRVGLSAPMLSQVVNGDRRPSLEIAIRIAEAANIPIGSLVTTAS